MLKVNIYLKLSWVAKSKHSVRNWYEKKTNS